MNLQNKTHRGGFTLIELLVVVSIIGLLSSIVLASLNEAKKKATASSIVQSFVQLRNALEMYRLQNGIVPCQYGKEACGSPFDGPGVTFSDFNGTTGFTVGLNKLVAQGFISKIPDIPGWKSGMPSSSYFVYTTAYAPEFTAGLLWYHACGSVPFGDYALMALSDNGDPEGVLKLMGMEKDRIYIYPYGALDYIIPNDNAYCITSK